MQTSLNQNFTPWSLLKFAAPSIAMMLLMSLYTIVDGIFVSRFVGSNALSALNIVYPVVNIAITIILYGQFLFNAFYLGFTIGTAPVVGFQYGAKETEKLRRIYRTSFLFVPYLPLTFCSAV